MRQMGNIRLQLSVGLALFAAAATCGCGGEKNRPIACKSVNSLSCAEDLLAMSRVVFVEIQQDVGYPNIAVEATEALFQALQKRRLFHVDVVPGTSPAVRELGLDRRREYTIDELAEMRKALDCDAVLLGYISHFQPYPRMQVCLSLRLLDLQRGKVVWAVDQVWDTTDKVTEQRIEKYFETQMRSGYEPADHSLAMMSPKTFLKFVSYEACDTLPTRAAVAGVDGLEPGEMEADNVLDSATATMRKLKKSLSPQ